MNISDAPPPSWPSPVGIIGAGAVGYALASALMASHVPLVGLGTRDPARQQTSSTPPLLSAETIVAQARLVFLTVPDSVVAAVAASFPWRPEQWVVHCAGAHPAALLAVAPAQSGAFHPLAAFPRTTTPPQTNRFAGRVVAVDGAPGVIAGLRALAVRLGAQALIVPPAARPAYHLAASLASNALVALIANATDVWATAGLDPDLALPALLPLVASTHANLEQVGLPTALTGPIARGDVSTVARHLAVLASDPTLAPVTAIYRLLGQRAVALARAQGHAAPAALDEIDGLLTE